MAKYNRNFGKLDESGNIEYAPLPLLISDENVWTNIPEAHIEQGYFPIQKTEQPIKEGFEYISYWAVENDVLVQKWEEHEVVIEPVVETLTTEEIQTAIREGVNSI